MNDQWTNLDQFIEKCRAMKDGQINEVCDTLADKVCTWDQEVFLGHLWMAKKMVDGGSHAALETWMKSTDEDAAFFRAWVERSGHRHIIARLYTGLKNRDIEELKTILHEG